MKYQIKSDKGYYSRSMSTGKAIFLDSSEMGYTFTKEEAERMLDKLEMETGKDLEIVEYKSYYAKGGEVRATNTADLIKQSMAEGSKKVKVEFYPSYDEKEHSKLSEKLKDSLKKAKVSIFDVDEEAFEIVNLVKNSKDVKSITWVKMAAGGMMAKGGNVKVKFDIESREDRTTISIKGIGKVVLVETMPEYEFIDDIDEEKLEELGVEEGDFIGKIEHIEIQDKYKGQGYAKLLMNKAIQVAKEKGLMPIFLNASPMGNRGLKINDLTAFYESFGFEVFLKQGNNNLMILNKKYADGGVMAKGGQIYNFDVVLYNDDEDYTIKEKKVFKVKASNRSSAYDKAKTKYPKPYFVELNSVDTYADGGELADNQIGFIPMDLEDKLALLSKWGGISIKEVIGILNAMIDSGLTDEDLVITSKMNTSYQIEKAQEKKIKEIWEEIEPQYKGDLKGYRYYSTLKELISRYGIYENLLKRFKPFRKYQKFADGGEMDGAYENYEMVVISKDAEKDGGGTHKHRYLVSAKNINEAKEIATELFYEEWGDADFYLFDIMTEDNYKMKYMANGGTTDSIAMTILKQLGGMNRLVAMTGAYNFVDLGNGVSFKIKNQKANYIKITLNSMDLYDLEVGRIRADTYKVIATHDSIYFDQLKPLIEKATGMYLSLFANGGNVQENDVFDAYVPPTPEEKAAKQQKQAEIAKMAMMFIKDGAEIPYDKLYELDINKLDKYERMKYNDLINRGISKEDTINVLINDTEGDYSQLSPELNKYVKWYKTYYWRKGNRKRKFAYGGITEEMNAAKNILGQDSWNRMSEEEKLNATKYLIRKGQIEGGREEYQYDNYPYAKGGRVRFQDKISNR